MILALLTTALAESWCAYPLEAHEWGVTVLAPQGGTVNTPGTPDWFHRHGHTRPAGPAVRTLPPDSGIRDLPVVQFFAWRDQTPVGLEVGFANGEASTWFPAVSRRIPAATSNSAAAYEAQKVLRVEQARPVHERGDWTGSDLGADPTRQLHWDHLRLTKEPVSGPHGAGLDWVTAARDTPTAMWVNGPGESDRFLFYEADTVESPAVVIEAGDSGKPDHFILRNTSDWDVFDVVFVHDGRAWSAPRIPAGKTAGFLLRDPFDPDATKSWLTDRWTADDGLPKPNYEECVMMRDPAVPVTASTSHRLFSAELDVLWTAWEDGLLDPKGTRLLYREDTAALDAVMPLSLYTDMFNDPSLHRLGVVMVENPALP